MTPVVPLSSMFLSPPPAPSPPPLVSPRLSGAWMQPWHLNGHRTAYALMVTLVSCPHSPELRGEESPGERVRVRVALQQLCPCLSHHLPAPRATGLPRAVCGGLPCTLPPRSATCLPRRGRMEGWDSLSGKAIPCPTSSQPFPVVPSLQPYNPGSGLLVSFHWSQASYDFCQIELLFVYLWVYP